MTRSIWLSRHNGSDHDDRSVDFAPLMVFHAGLIAVAASPLETLETRLQEGHIWPIILGIIGLILSFVGWYVFKKNRSDIEARFKLIRHR